jgi:uncharacterized protein with PIN domain
LAEQQNMMNKISELDNFLKMDQHEIDVEEKRCFKCHSKFHKVFACPVDEVEYDENGRPIKNIHSRYNQ